MKQPQQVTIHFTCPNGHRGRAPLRLAGRVLPCGICGEKAMVGRASKHTQISDSGVCAILTEGNLEAALTGPESKQPGDEIRLDQPAATPPAAAKKARLCRRCREPLSMAARACHACHLIQESGRTAFRSVYRAAMRWVR